MCIAKGAMQRNGETTTTFPNDEQTFDLVLSSMAMQRCRAGEACLPRHSMRLTGVTCRSAVSGK